VRVDTSLAGEVRIRFEDRVELPRLYLTWLTPAMFAEGDADLDLATDLLANGKTSRLYRRLVFDERLATDVSASQNSREMAGYAQVTATAAPGHTLGELERAILEEIARLSTARPDRGRDRAGPHPGRVPVRLPAADRRRFRRQVRSVECLQRVQGDPAYFERDLERYQVVTAESLRQAVARYLDPGHRVTLSIVPRDRTGLAAPNSSPAVVS
jgi:predicted Zn-dependent peptidase